MKRDFLFWGAKLERWLLRVVVLCAVFVVTVQWFVYDPAVRAISKAGADLNDGTPISASELEHLVTIQLLDYSNLPRAAVLVNGEKKGSFVHRYVTVPVNDGDVLAIDAQFYREQVSFKVMETYGNVQYPKTGMIINVRGSIKNIGTVKIGTSG